MISGPIAAGKSTVCGHLLEHLSGYAFVDKAYLKNALKPIGKDEAKKIAAEACSLMVDRLMEAGKNILVHELSMKNLGETVKKYDYECCCFYLKCSPETSVKRDEARVKKSHNPEYVISTHSKVLPQEGEIIINTEEKTIEETVDYILKKIEYL